MEYKKDKYLLMDKKTHYKMYKAGKKWLVAGIATFGFGIAMPISSAQAETKSINVMEEKPEIIKNSLVDSGSTNGFLTRNIQNFSQEPSFSQQYNDVKLTDAQVKKGYIKAGTDETGSLRLNYFNGMSTSNTDLNNQTSSAVFFAPNFNIQMGNGTVWDWVFSHGGFSTSKPFFAGINNDWATEDAGSNWRIWSIEQGPTAGITPIPGDDAINSTITMKFSGDFKFKTSKKYTLDFTMTLKPNGSTVDYGLSIRNVTSLVSGVSAEDAKLPGFWFASRFDTMLGDNDLVPIYFTGENQGLYLKNGNYKLLFNYTSNNAPTGWSAGHYSSAFPTVGLTTPSDLGQKGKNAAKDTVALKNADTGLFLSWKAEDLVDGASRTASYQASISSDTAKVPKVELNEMTKNYTGKEIEIAGKVSYENTEDEAHPLHYYYSIDSGPAQSFDGPQFTDTDEHPFSFKIPENTMSVGNEHSISVYVKDNYGSSSETKFIRLTAKSELVVEDKEFFVGDKFDKFSCLRGGTKVDGEPIRNSDITSVVVKKENGEVVSDFNQVIANPGKYTITYTYAYGSGDKGGKEEKTANLTVLAANDLERGADFTLREQTYYVGDHFNAARGFVSGRKPGASMTASDLQHIITKADSYVPIIVNDEDVTRNVGDYKIDYSYGYGNNGQTITKTSTIHVIDAKHIILNYVDQNGNSIDQSMLSGIDSKMAAGSHDGNYGESFTVNAPANLPANETNHPYFEFDHAEVDSNPIQNNSQLTFGDNDQNVKLVYKGAVVDDNDNATSRVTIHHCLEDGTSVPGMQDTLVGGRIGDKITVNLNDESHKAPAGYEQVPNQTFEPWTLKPNQGKEFTIKYRGTIQDNITIDFIDATSGETVASTKPQGVHRTGDKLDLGSEGVAGILPPGYHFAEQNELNGHTQPGNVKYTTQEQRPKVYVVGNKINDNAENAVTIHHYLQKPDGTKTTTKVPGLEDIHKGGRVGEKRTFEPTAAPTGYTSVSTPVEWTFKANEGKVINFYYTADKQDNITIDFVDAISGEIVASTKPQGDHYTGDKLDLGSEGVAGILPPGYHFAEQNELNGHTQPGSVKYTTQEQHPKVYVVGDKIDDNATNAVTIHHYLQKSDGTKTTTKVPGLEDRHEGGRVGETKTFTPSAAPAGYTLKSQPVEWTFKANEGKLINFYYEANDASNITVKFRSSRTDKDITTDRPQGLTGDVLDLSATSSYVAGKTPKGYHYSTSNELRSNQKQATNLTFGLTPQTTTVYLTPEKDTSIEITLEDATTGEKIKVKPENHFTGDELDLKNNEEIKNKIPDGFHIAEPGELGEGKGQPTENPKYDTTHKEEKIYIIGDKIDKNATNAVTIHHYLQKSDGTKTTTKVPGLEDRHEGGRVGEKRTFEPTAAPIGYTSVSQPVEWTFKVNEGKVINFYYEAGEQNNIKVHFINVKNGKELVTDNPVGTTGSVLDLAPTADYVQGMLNSKTELKGYHYATGRELNGQTQSKNPTYTTSEQHVNVFVAGDKVSGDNAVSVQHRLKENGQLTDKPVPGMRDFSKDGYVGDEFTFKTDDREQQAPRGYKLVDGQADQLRTLGLTAPDPVIFYYEAIEQNNVTVAFVNTETGAVVGTDKPSGAFGSTLDLTPNGSYLANKIPSGYHYAKRGELKSGQQQPRNLTYTTEDQTVRVYIAADVISDDSEDAVTIHHYVKGTNDKVVGLDDIKRGGRYGETVTFKKDAPEHLAPKGYKMSDDQTDLSWTFGQQGGDRNLRFDYEKVDLNNITVKYVNIKNNQVILTENPVGKIGEVLNLHIGEDLELPRELVSGYKYPTTDELAGRTQATNPTYSSKDQEVTVYVTPKGFDPTNAQMKIKYVNVNNPDDTNLSNIWEVDLTGHYEGESIDLNQTIKMKDTSVTGSDYSPQTIIPKNYHYADKSELKDGQIQKEKLTYTNGTITIYVVGNWIDASNPEAPVITHRLNSYNGAFVPGLRDIRQGGRYGDPVMINVKDPIHRSRKYDPKKYSVDTDGSTKPIPSNGLIQTSFGQIITIIYGR